MLCSEEPNLVSKWSKDIFCCFILIPGNICCIWWPRLTIWSALSRDTCYTGLLYKVHSCILASCFSECRARRKYLVFLVRTRLSNKLQNKIHRRRNQTWRFTNSIKERSRCNVKDKNLIRKSAKRLLSSLLF